MPQYSCRHGFDGRPGQHTGHPGIDVLPGEGTINGRGAGGAAGAGPGVDPAEFAAPQRLSGPQRRRDVPASRPRALDPGWVAAVVVCATDRDGTPGRVHPVVLAGAVAGNYPHVPVTARIKRPAQAAVPPGMAAVVLLVPAAQVTDRQAVPPRAAKPVEQVPDIGPGKERPVPARPAGRPPLQAVQLQPGVERDGLPGDGEFMARAAVDVTGRVRHARLGSV